MTPQESISELDLLQDAILGRITNDAYFSTIVVLEERKGVTDEDLAQTLASNTKRGGKKGAAIVICDPFFDIDNSSGPGPRIDPTIYIRCITRPMVNEAPSGANARVKQMATNICKLLHFYLIQGQGLNVTLEAHKGDPVSWIGGEREMTVTMKTSLQLEPFCKCAFPMITRLSSTTASITCATAGAIIYYTLDGSFPGPSNSAAVIYSGVIDFAAGTQVSAVAYSPTPTTQVASDLVAQTIS
jgi:hypothetical protein